MLTTILQSEDTKWNVVFTTLKCSMNDGSLIYYFLEAKIHAVWPFGMIFWWFYSHLEGQFLIRTYGAAIVAKNLYNGTSNDTTVVLLFCSVRRDLRK